jgi:hypothetical protein
MVGRDSDDHSLTPNAERLSVPADIAVRNESDVDCRVGEIRDQVGTRSVDQACADIWKSAVVFDEGGSQIPCRQRRVDSDYDTAAFPAGSRSEARCKSVGFLHNPQRGFKEFLSFYCGTRTPIAALEKDGTQLEFEVTQAPAECRLADTQRLGRPTKASMSRGYNRPSHCAKFDAHSSVSCLNIYSSCE